MWNVRVWSIFALCLLVGCSSGDTREYGKLSGTVKLNGNPPPAGTIVSLVNVSNGAATSAPTKADGTYIIPRAQVGDYQVGFAVQGESSAGGAEIDPDEAMKQIADGTYKAPDSKTTIPDKYRSPETSGLTASVQLGDNVADFDL
ncbi:MAG: carboxypeptidase regulatory-like domain-containing protein [Planctomycetaceae bacterium]|nr:carboxypeptidase regulatory-like domain-containing protein [Planctomycetaceae bacterium]